MALSEISFGPSVEDASVYLDTSQSEMIDATAGNEALLVPGEGFELIPLTALPLVDVFN